MSSSTSSSSPKEETYEEEEEDREFETQAKRLKTEEGEIGYSVEESETRQEATPWPQAGSDSDGGGSDEGGSGGGPRNVSTPWKEVEVIIKFLSPLLCMSEGSVSRWWKPTLWRRWRNLGQYAT
ncbi:uncharacterized protein LOC143270013 [Peromyscus maniculatus bairdii]|uniref:uncharacterized protein LOC143270013 n=1 Tax=Peromyscus maniculatus bairdii TaxID=230844 RepID=UPI003FD383F3